MKHGSAVTYRKKGCRCEPCTAASAADMADYRKRRYLARGSTLADPTGTSRRLQALAAIGWGIADLAPLLGIQQSVVARHRAGEHRPLRVTADAVAELYERLSMTPGPSHKARRWAYLRGWMPPLAWDDIDDPAAWADLGGNGTDIVDTEVVRRLIAGAHWRDIGATEAERLAAAAVLPRTHDKRLGIGPSALARVAS